MKKLLFSLMLLAGISYADTGDILLSSNFQENTRRALDARTTVTDATARLATPSINRYDGLAVYQRSDHHTWQLQGDTNTWVDITASSSTGSGTPASPNYSVQYDSNGVFGGSSNFLWDGSTVNISNVSVTSFTAVSSMTLSNIYFDVSASTHNAGVTLINGSAGTSGQVFTSNGANASPTWTTINGGGSGTINASQNGNVPRYSAPGSSTALSGSTNLEVYTSSVVTNQTVTANLGISASTITANYGTVGTNLSIISRNPNGAALSSLAASNATAGTSLAFYADNNVFPASASNAIYCGSYSEADMNGSVDHSAAFIYGAFDIGQNVSLSTTNYVGGSLSEAFANSTGTIRNLLGSQNISINQGGGVITNAVGVAAESYAVLGSTTISSFGVFVDTGATDGTGVIKRNFGVWVGSETIGQINYGFFSQNNLDVFVGTTTVGNLVVSNSPPENLIGSQSGHIISSGTVPNMGTCGSSPSVNGTDTAGVITVGGGVVTSCAMNFLTPYKNPPVCTQSTNSTAVTADITSITASTVTFGFSATLGGGTVWYLCVGNKG